MSLDEYNRHSILGPLAGPATNASSIAGQDAYRRNNEPATYTADGDETIDPKGILKTFALIGGIGALSGISTFFLPETLALITGALAALCAVGLIILTLHVGLSVAKLTLSWAAHKIFNQGWWWVMALPLTAFITTTLYDLHPAIIGTITTLTALCATTLKCQKRIRTLLNKTKN